MYQPPTRLPLLNRIIISRTSSLVRGDHNARHEVGGLRPTMFSPLVFMLLHKRAYRQIHRRYTIVSGGHQVISRALNGTRLLLRGPVSTTGSMLGSQLENMRNSRPLTRHEIMDLRGILVRIGGQIALFILTRISISSILSVTSTGSFTRLVSNPARPRVRIQPCGIVRGLT